MKKVNAETMTAEIDLNEDAVYRVRDGNLVKLDEPATGYGKQTITWLDSKPSHYEVSYTRK